MSSGKTFSQSPYQEEWLLCPAVFSLIKLPDLGCCEDSKGVDVGCSMSPAQHSSTACSHCQHFLQCLSNLGIKELNWEPGLSASSEIKNQMKVSSRVTTCKWISGSESSLKTTCQSLWTCISANLEQSTLNVQQFCRQQMWLISTTSRCGSAVLEVGVHWESPS